jgi:WXG100 family type VII secretion target
MSNSYKFNFSIADDTCDHMDTVNSTISQALQELESHCQSSLADWSGAAQTQYTQAQAEWNAGLQTMTQALQQGRMSLFNISEGYGSAETRATQIWANTYTGR